ncbi:FtsX-like permease family protein [Maribellus comscasis]|uniref:FtsX-like permease family protein n=1 Tax=Maribellus comscasis TaxID=2681766 RepID=A0A6I6JUE1_9BACT|nr:ABC transporter permease [Maribellus comscasis]QGY44668.1 FtsX-like permease family protein [Maribellus comscasis]
MLNIFKLTIRISKRQPLSFSINIIGFAIGIACVFIITLWIQSQFGFDQFHKNYKNIYRIVEHGKINNEDVYEIYIPPLFGPEFTKAVPEIKNSVRFYHVNNSVFKYNQQAFYENNGYFTDNTIFELFDFPLLVGDQNSSLAAPNSIVISKSMSSKYFSNNNPIGKTIEIEGEGYTVTAVFKEIPENSHLQFDFLLSMTTLITQNKYFEDWNSNRVYTYLLLYQNAKIELIEKKMQNVISENTSLWDDLGLSYQLQPLSEIYLDHRYNNEKLKTSDRRNLYIFSFVVLAILLISCINFINLFEAQNTTRNKEVGINKILGAKRISLIFQFISETFIHIIIAAIIAIALIGLSLPIIDATFKLNLKFNLHNPMIWLCFTGTIVIIGLFAGLFPALYLSSLQPVMMLKGKLPQKVRPWFLKNGLIIIQFFISMVLLATTLFVSKQKEFLLSKKLGFNKEQIIYLPIKGILQKRFPSFKEELLKISKVKSVTAKSCLVTTEDDGGPVWSTGMTYEQGPLAERCWVSYDYFKTLDIKISGGRSFSKEFGRDNEDVCILNQKAIDEIGLKNPIGKEIFFNNERRVVVGVIEDVLTKSLHNTIFPQVYLFKEGNWNPEAVAFIKYTGNAAAVISSIKKEWQSINPDEPFSYEFLDNTYRQMYSTETRIALLFKIFTSIAMVLSCLGLFGVSLFVVQRRTKEIGIRKVNGAKIFGVMALLNKDFIKWIAIAFGFATPIAYYAMNKWLENFAYKTTLSWWIFAMAGVLALGIALLTVSWQSWRAATRNPVESLRYE